MVLDHAVGGARRHASIPSASFELFDHDGSVGIELLAGLAAVAFKGQS